MNKKQPSKYNKLDTKQRSFGSWNKDLIVQLSNASAELYWKLHKTTRLEEGDLAIVVGMSHYYTWFKLFKNGKLIMHPGRSALTGITYPFEQDKYDDALLKRALALIKKTLSK